MENIDPSTNQTPIIPDDQSPPVPNETPTQPLQPIQTKKTPWLLIILIVALIGIAGYFGSQNYQLKQQLVDQQPTPTSTANSPLPTISPTTEADPTINWITFTNKVFSIKLPKTFDYDERSSTSPSNMYFSWVDQKNTTPKIAIGIDLGYTQGDPKLVSCKTNEECWQGYQKSFSVAGFNTINTIIDGNSVKGFETSNKIYQNLYPISHNGKLFTIDIQITAPTTEEAKLQMSQINQILSTFQFIE